MKYKLTRLEYETIKYAHYLGYKWIACDEDGEVCVYSKKPFKNIYVWRSSDDICDNVFSGLFLFIKWTDEEPCLIEDILSDCAVIKDE